ncbi:MAG TPA: transposase [Kofleriaceae bacterium]|nr:transposase [Kofleriaceae bacterium]
MTLDLARRPTGRGGWRPGSGRRKGTTQVPHATREDFAARYPQHVTLRLVDGVPSLREYDRLQIIWDAIRRAQSATFRIVEFNVEPNHLHLVSEAAGKAALATGMQGFKARMAKRLNRHLGRSGALFEERYHARVLRTPREVKHAIRYVLCNWRHHVSEREVLPADWIDPYSSAFWFDGWRRELVLDEPWKRDLAAMSPPTVKPTVWLLSIGWRMHGLLEFDEVPGPKKQTKRARTRRNGKAH